ncbi:Holliday junction resolvase RecU [Orenia marismortui]|uniref:Holliday junction resolvase RecU n=1 Tax=Orenia marismortui TaxID=46469 RepID=A0A4R8GZI1_9FIRM|nr:Holliday junction resolvase RecU [Orenia marismortui]TDX52156.1 recombination protein U [Orenia marismortui]
MSIYANRGMELEEAIEYTNQEYFFKQRALAQKVPTPVKVLNINSRTGRITNGHYDKKSTVDYIGVYNGIPLAFEAKETAVKTRFDLSNIKDHQFYFLDHWQNNGGLSFLIISFTSLNECYYLPFEVLDQYWVQMESGGRKSIPYDVVAKDKYRIEQGKGMILLDYISVIKEVIA